MNKKTKNFPEHRGAIPPQLVKYIGTRDMATATREFIEYINRIARNFHKNIVPKNPYDIAHAPVLRAPRVAGKLFGQNVKLSYLGGGTSGSVYKMTVGDDVFALKLNREPDAEDRIAFDLQKKARSLINRAYVSSAVPDKNGQLCDWIVSDYVDGDAALDSQRFQLAKEKLFFAAISKGLHYSDAGTPGNIRDGKIVDHNGLYMRTISLTRVEIDMVKKILRMMRIDDENGFEELAVRAVARHPNVIHYMFVQMNLMQMEMPVGLQKYKQKLGRYNTELRSRMAADKNRA